MTQRKTKMILSNAAKANWERLHPDSSQKLKKGANKTRSEKRMYPKEYITDAETYSFLDKILHICDEDSIPAEVAVYSLAVKLLEKAGILHAGHVQETLQPYSFPVSQRIFDSVIPSGERDILGIVYQSLLSEGEKNILGSYYTPYRIISKMLTDIKTDGGLFLDPCCGSGAFLAALKHPDPEQLWGCDCDPVAVMIAKVNLLCQYSNSVFIPHVFCCDYLSGPDLFPQAGELFQKKFDCIATNPPWGAKESGKRQSLSDSFSRFFTKSYEQLIDGGRIAFLFPEAILNIRAHLKIREMLLTETRLRSILFFEENFTGVMTKYVSVCAEKLPPASNFLIGSGKNMLKKKVSDILAQKDRIISFSGSEDEKILCAINAMKRYDLSDSIFALGIVTGNNKEKLHQTQISGMEPVYTGKEVDRYLLKKARHFILYKRNDFQQTAKDEYYRAPEKLVYKFISRQMVFAYDDSQSLFLNSANILIPAIPGYSIKTVLAFLNSKLLRYCYMKSFKDIKILKNNLCQLPFPEITPEIRNSIEQIVGRILQGDCSDDAVLQRIIFNCYRLDEEQISHIQNSLSYV